MTSPLGGVEFHDGGLRVHIKANNEVVITLYYGNKKGKATVNNPVIMIDNAGNIYRSHAEWRFGVPRMLEATGNPKHKGGFIPCPYHYDD